MSDVTIYASPTCYYCTRAKDLFDQLNVPYTLIDISKDDSLREEMVEKSGGRRTVPQIFLKGTHIGGFDELNTLHKEDKLSEHLNH